MNTKAKTTDTKKAAATETAPALYPKDVPFTTLVIHVADAKATPPARPGSARAKRYAVLAKMDGKTIAEYYAALRKLGSPCQKNNPVNAAAKGFITLTAPAPAK